MRAAAKGLTVSIGAQTRWGRSATTDDLRAGIPICTNGTMVGCLRQTEHRDLRRSRRVMHVKGTTPHHFPEGLHFRLRGIGSVSLEKPAQRLIGYWPVPLRLARVHPQATPELVALFATVDHAFATPLRAAGLPTRRATPED